MGDPGAGRAQPPAAQVDALFAQWNKQGSPGCSAAVSRNGAVVYEHASGMASIEWGAPLTPDTVMGAASISKQFTAMSILLLAERGKLSLDDEVDKYVPGWADRKSHVTIRHLLTHTSGLREGFSLVGLAQQSPWEDYNAAIERALARQKDVDAAPGAEWQYDNGGYNLLGSIVKRVSGQSLRDFEQANIFTPLGMTHSQIRDDRALLIPHVASGYTEDGAGVHPTSEAIGVVGNAGLYTTPRDLLLWAQNLQTPRVGAPAAVTEMQTSAVLNNGKPTNYGFGLFLRSYRGLRTVEHSGGDRGIASNLVSYPDQKLAIALICNSDAIDPIDLTHKLTDLYLEDALGPRAANEVPAVPVALSRDELAARAGVYRVTEVDGGMPDLEVSVRDGKLVGHSAYYDDTDFDLTPTDSTHVRMPGGTTLQFVPQTPGYPQAWIGPQTSTTLRGALILETYTPAPALLRGYAGDYRSAEIESSWDVAVEGSRLMMRPAGSSEWELKPFGKDAFLGPGVGVVKFVRDPRGQVVGFTMNRYNLRGLRFDRYRRAG
jgi:CubicO group peptidase (beta-lactamase class C family)